jgi:3-dehydroquinate synthase
MIKHGFILSEELFELLKKPLARQIEDIIARNITIKRDIVAKDERDNGIRQILNFGHTAGHGIEKNSGYSITHGKAVAIGMAIACRGAFRTGLCSEDCYTQLIDVLKQYRLPFVTDIPAEKLIEASLSDKKRRNQNITLIVPEKIGKCVLKNFSMEEAAAFFKLGMKE